MRLVKLILINAFFFFFSNAFGQNLRSDPGAAAAPGGDFGGNSRGITEVRFGKINSDRVNYSDIKGDPFWNPEWQSAIVYINDIRAGRLSVKLNFAAGELHFLRDSEELVLTGINITKLVFDKIDEPIVFISHVPNLRLDGKDLEGFVQVMNPGDYQLLKYTARKVKSSDAKPGAPKYIFYDDVYYFLRSNIKVERIKKRTKEGFLSFLPGASSLDKWIWQSDINFEEEGGMIKFLQYFNSQRKGSLSSGK